MLERQKILVELVARAPDGRMSRRKLERCCFLLAKAWRDPGPASVYSFVPHTHGPFSFTLHHELERLVHNGELSVCDNDKDVFRQQGAVSMPLSPGSRKAVSWLMNGYGNEPAARLGSFVFRSYPWYTLNCHAAERRAASLPQVPCRIYTAGYEGFQVDAFMNRLLENGIRRIIDVRANPISRKYGFHKSTLAKITASLKMSYVHMPELGIPSPWRSELACADDYTALFARYRAEILPPQKDSIMKIGEFMKEMPSVALCQEADPSLCHRSHLADTLSKITGMDIRNI